MLATPTVLRELRIFALYFALFALGAFHIYSGLKPSDHETPAEFHPNGFTPLRYDEFLPGYQPTSPRFTIDSRLHPTICKPRIDILDLVMCFDAEDVAPDPQRPQYITPSKKKKSLYTQFTEWQAQASFIDNLLTGIFIGPFIGMLFFFFGYYAIVPSLLFISHVLSGKYFLFVDREYAKKNAILATSHTYTSDTTITTGSEHSDSTNSVHQTVAMNTSVMKDTFDTKSYLQDKLDLFVKHTRKFNLCGRTISLQPIGNFPTPWRTQFVPYSDVHFEYYTIDKDTLVRINLLLMAYTFLPPRAHPQLSINGHGLMYYIGRVFSPVWRFTRFISYAIVNKAFWFGLRTWISMFAVNSWRWLWQKSIPWQAEFAANIFLSLAQLYIAATHPHKKAAVAIWFGKFLAEFHVASTVAQALTSQADKLSTPAKSEDVPVAKPQLFTDWTFLLPSLLTITTYFLGGKISALSDMKPSGPLRAIAQGVHDWKTLEDNLGPLFRHVINSIYQFFTGSEEPYIKSLYDPVLADMKTWCEEVRPLLADPDKFGSDYQIALQGQQLIARGAALSTRGIEVGLPPNFGVHFSHSYQLLLSFEARISACIQGGTKPRTFWAHICGPPGTGKTDFIPLLFNLVYMARRGVPLTQQEVFTPTFGARHMNGFTKWKKVAYVHDVGRSDNPDQCKAEGDFINNACETAAQLFEMAAIREKFDSYSHLEAIASSGNDPFPALAHKWRHSHSKPKTISRRADICLALFEEREGTERKVDYLDLRVIPKKLMEDQAMSEDDWWKAVRKLPPTPLAEVVSTICNKIKVYQDTPPPGDFATMAVTDDFIKAVKARYAPSLLAKPQLWDMLDSYLPLYTYEVREIVDQMVHDRCETELMLRLKQVADRIPPDFDMGPYLTLTAFTMALLVRADTRNIDLSESLKAAFKDEDLLLVHRLWKSEQMRHTYVAPSIVDPASIYNAASMTREEVIDFLTFANLTTEQRARFAMNIYSSDVRIQSILEFLRRSHLNRLVEMARTQPEILRHLQDAQAEGAGAFNNAVINLASEHTNRSIASAVAVIGGSIVAIVCILLLNALWWYGVYRFIKWMITPTVEIVFVKEPQEAHEQSFVEKDPKTRRLPPPPPVIKKVRETATAHLQVATFADVRHLEQVRAAIAPNEALIKFPHGVASVTFVCDQRAIINSHTAKYLRNLDPTTPVEILGMRPFSCKASDIKIEAECGNHLKDDKLKKIDPRVTAFVDEYEGSEEWVQVRFPPNLPSFRDITKHFISEKDWHLVFQSGTFVKTLDPLFVPKEQDDDPSEDIWRCTAPPIVFKKIDFDSHLADSSMYGAIGFRVEKKPRDGESGKLYLTLNHRVQGPIFGIHSAEMTIGDNNYIICTRVTREALLSALGRTASPPAPLLPAQVGDVRVLDTLDGFQLKANTQILRLGPGAVARGVLPPEHAGGIYGTTALKRTDMCAWQCLTHTNPRFCKAAGCDVQYPVKAPALQHRYKMRIPGTDKYFVGDPAEETMQKYMRHLPTVHTVDGVPILDWCLSHLTDDVIRKMIPEPTSPLDNLRIIDTLVANPQHPDCPPITRQTAANLPWKHVRLPHAAGTSHKYTILVCEKHTSGGCYLSQEDCKPSYHPEFIDVFEAMMETCAKDEMPELFWNFFLKDECLPLEKLVARLILGAPAHLQVAFMLAFGPVLSGIVPHAHDPDHWIRVGVACGSKRWCDVLAQLIVKYPHLIQGDHKWWDFCHTALDHELARHDILRAIHIYFPESDSPRRQIIRRRLLEVIQDPNVSVARILIEFANILPTGNPICASYNSIINCNQIYLAFCFTFTDEHKRLFGKKSELPEGMTHLQLFCQLYSLHVYGDDFALLATEKARSYILTCTHLAIIKSALFGTDLTSPDKHTPLPEWYRSDEWSFLKRFILQTPAGGSFPSTISNPLELDSLTRPLDFTFDPSPTGMISVLTNALYELFAYGDLAFEESRKTFVAYLEERNVINADQLLPTLEKAVESTKTAGPMRWKYDYLTHITGGVAHPQMAAVQAKAIPTPEPSDGVVSTMTTVAETEPIIEVESHDLEDESGKHSHRDYYAMFKGRMAPHVFIPDKSIVERWATCGAFNWTTSSNWAAGALLTLNLPYDVMNSGLLLNHIEYFQSARYSCIRFQLRITTTQNYAGIMWIYFLPNDDSSHTTYDADQSTAAHALIAIVDASVDTNVDFEIPWVCPYPWIRKSVLDQYPAINGRLVFRTAVQPWSSSINPVTSMHCHVQAMIKDLELSMPDSSSALPLAVRKRVSLAPTIPVKKGGSAHFQMSAKPATGGKKDDAAATLARIGSMIPGVGKEGGKKTQTKKEKPTKEQTDKAVKGVVAVESRKRLGDTIPIIGDLVDFGMDFIGGAINLGGQAITAVGPAIEPVLKALPAIIPLLDKPTDIAKSSATHDEGTLSLVHGDGLFYGASLSLARKATMAMVAGGNWDLKRLAELPNYLTTYTFNSATAYKAQIFALSFDPRTLANASQSGAGPYTITTTANWAYSIARLYKFYMTAWRVLLYFATTSVTTGRVRLIWNAPASADPADPETDGGDMYSIIINIRGSTKVKLELYPQTSMLFCAVPPINNGNQSAGLQSTGKLYAYCINPAAIPDSSGSSAQIAIQAFTAMKNPQFWEWCGPSNQAAGVAPEMPKPAAHVKYFSYKEDEPPAFWEKMSPEEISLFRAQQQIRASEASKVVFRPTVVEGTHIAKPQMDVKAEFLNDEGWIPIGDARRMTIPDHVGGAPEITEVQHILKRFFFVVALAANQNLNMARIDSGVSYHSAVLSLIASWFLGWSGTIRYAAENYGNTSGYHGFVKGWGSTVPTIATAAAFEGGCHRCSLKTPLIQVEYPYVRPWLYDFTVPNSINVGSYSATAYPALNYVATSFTNGMLSEAVGEDFALYYPMSPGSLSQTSSVA